MRHFYMKSFDKSFPKFCERPIPATLTAPNECWWLDACHTGGVLAVGVSVYLVSAVSLILCDYRTLEMSVPPSN